MMFVTVFGLAGILAASLFGTGSHGEEKIALAVDERAAGYEALAAQSDYCAVSPDHTACLYSSVNQTGSCAATIEKRGVTEEQIQQLLAAHNAKRRLAAKGLVDGQPMATNMAALTWNGEAAAIAQLWADQCTPGHDKRRDTVKPNASQNGQNIHGMSGDDVLDFSTALDGWFDEAKDLDPSNVDSFNPTDFHAVGHYTQLVWAESTEVGCGYIYQDEEHKLVCNYSPTGNWRDQPIYLTTGAPSLCAACPSSLPNCDDGLCTA